MFEEIFQQLGSINAASITLFCQNFALN